MIGQENDADWYEACNPATNARGFVPVSYFQGLGRTQRDSGESSGSPKNPDHDSGYSDKSGGSIPGTDITAKQPRMSKSMGKASGAMVYGIVQYDFTAERPDELDAKAEIGRASCRERV